MNGRKNQRENGRGSRQGTGLGQGTQQGAKLVLKAQELDDKGEGVCIHLAPGRGLYVHVPGLLPGEHAQVAVEHLSPHGRGHRHGQGYGQGHRPGQGQGQGHAPDQEQEQQRWQEAWGRIVTRLDATPERVVPACAAYGRCGGCVLQHMAYSAQLRWKQQRVADALAAVLSGDFWKPGNSAEGQEPAVLPCVAAASPLGYRSRVKLVAAVDPAGRLFLGAYAPRSHEVIDMAGCQVNLPSLTALAKSVAKAANELGLSCYDEARGSGSLRYVLLRETRALTQQLSLVLADPAPEPRLHSFVRAITAVHPRLSSIVLHHNRDRGNALLNIGFDAAPLADKDQEGPSPTSPRASNAPALPAEGGRESPPLLDREGPSQTPDPARNARRGEAQPALPAEGGREGPPLIDRVLYGDAHVWEEIGPVSLRVSARSFLQVNREVAARIYGDVAAWVPAGSDVLDLYCGVGGLGLTVLARVPNTRLTGIEANASAVADAEASAHAAGFASAGRARFFCGDAAELLEAHAHAAQVVLLNPPRRGCDRAVLQSLLAHPPLRIVYVSCNPDSLARDLLFLCMRGYRLRHVAPYDMHPGTPHIETVAVLEAIPGGGA